MSLQLVDRGEQLLGLTAGAGRSRGDVSVKVHHSALTQLAADFFQNILQRDGFDRPIFFHDLFVGIVAHAVLFALILYNIGVVSQSVEHITLASKGGQISVCMKQLQHLLHLNARNDGGRSGGCGDLAGCHLLMGQQSAQFKTAYEAGTVTYQWYKDGEAIEGETDPVYNFKAEDVGSGFYVTVTVGSETVWGDTHKCYNHLYQIYLNATEIVAGGKAPAITSATPGVSIDPESLVIREGKDQPDLDIHKTLLVPGKTYIVIGRLMQTGEANIPYGANVYVNGTLMDDQVDGIYCFFYKFTVLPEADYPVYYKTNGAVGIGVTLTVDVDKMCNESATFKNAYDKANPTYQTVFYQWYKNGEAIEGATDISYTVKTTDRDSLYTLQGHSR